MVCFGFVLCLCGVGCFFFLQGEGGRKIDQSLYAAKQFTLIGKNALEKILSDGQVLQLEL